MTMAYTVTYRELDTTTMDEHDAIMQLETEEVELEDVIENCTTYRINAALYDAAGFAKGWVHADGTYQLQ
jgi:hypothetical protein